MQKTEIKLKVKKYRKCINDTRSLRNVIDTTYMDLSRVNKQVLLL